MGIVSTILLVIGFLLKAKGVTFVEFFPKKPEPATSQVIYNNVISQAPANPYGIDAKFDRFEKLDKFSQGTGLGLHICKLIAGGLHGTVEIDRNYSGGSKFIFKLPIAK